MWWCDSISLQLREEFVSKGQHAKSSCAYHANPLRHNNTLSRCRGSVLICTGQLDTSFYWNVYKKGSIHKRDTCYHTRIFRFISNFTTTWPVKLNAKVWKGNVHLFSVFTLSECLPEVFHLWYDAEWNTIWDIYDSFLFSLQEFHAFYYLRSNSGE